MIEALGVVPLDYVGAFLVAFSFDIQDQLGFDVFDAVCVGLVVEDESKSLIKSLVDWILDNLNSWFRGSFRYIHRHVGKGVFK